MGSSCFGWGVFPPSRRGKCCPFLSFCFFFRVWLGVFCRFFSVLLFLGSLFGRNFRERTFVFWVIGVGRVYFGAVLPMFSALLFGSCRSRNYLEKILFWSGPLFGINFRERTFVFVDLQPYCHTFLATSTRLCPFSKGEVLSSFSLFGFFWVWFGVFCRFFYRSSFLRVAV